MKKIFFYFCCIFSLNSFAQKLTKESFLKLPVPTHIVDQVTQKLTGSSNQVKGLIPKVFQSYINAPFKINALTQNSEKSFSVNFDYYYDHDNSIAIHSVVELTDKSISIQNKFSFLVSTHIHLNRNKFINNVLTDYISVNIEDDSLKFTLNSLVPVFPFIIEEEIQDFSEAFISIF
jgi:hypothetical protein